MSTFLCVILSVCAWVSRSFCRFCDVMSIYFIFGKLCVLHAPDLFVFFYIFFEFLPSFRSFSHFFSFFIYKSLLKNFTSSFVQIKCVLWILMWISTNRLAIFNYINTFIQKRKIKSAPLVVQYGSFAVASHYLLFASVVVFIFIWKIFLCVSLIGVWFAHFKSIEN